MAISALQNSDDRDLVIQAIDLRKTYDTGGVQVHALAGVSLAVKRGEMVAVMGPSGCGKTTLLNCLSGLDDFEGGLVLIEGQDISKLADDRKTEFRATDMGFVFQTYNRTIHMADGMIARENTQAEMVAIAGGTEL